MQSIPFDGSVQVYPNPAITSARVELELKSARTVSLSLLDGAGRVVYEATPVNCPSGKTVLTLPMNNLATGTYFYRLSDTKEGLLQGGQLLKK